MQDKHELQLWGWSSLILEDDLFRVRRLCLHPGKRMDLHCHMHSRETITVLEGAALVEIDGHPYGLTQGQTVNVPLGAAHRIGHTGVGAIHILETRIGGALEHDVVRLSEEHAQALTERAKGKPRGLSGADGPVLYFPPL